jgi:putative ABC transport system permease protein
LGALPGQIVTRFLMQGLGVSFIACVTGLGLGAAFTRLLSGMLFGVSPSDTITQASVVLIVMSVAMIASLLPAIRAARLDPIEALRDE